MKTIQLHKFERELLIALLDDFISFMDTEEQEEIEPRGITVANNILEKLKEIEE